MSGIKLYDQIRPYTEIIPVWTKGHYYANGSFVVVKTGDSDQLVDGTCQLDYFIATRTHPQSEHNPNDSENNGWYLFTSNKVFDSDDFSFASLRSKVYGLKFDFDSDNAFVTQVLQQSNAKADDLISGSGTFGPSVLSLNSRLSEVESRGIIDYIDSDSVHLGILIWDSDDNSYKTIRTVLSLNGAPAGLDNNIPVNLIPTLRGTLDDRPNVASNGTIFTVFGDSESINNGSVFVFKDGEGWLPIVNNKRVDTDARYINRDSDVMVGSLFINYTPSDDQDAVSKRYVDETINGFDSDKEDIIPQYQSITDVDEFLQTGRLFISRDTTTLYTKQTQTDNVAVNSTPQFLFETFLDVSVVSGVVNDFIVVEYRNISNKYPGTLVLRENGSNFPFVPAGNCTLTGGFRTLTPNQTQFSIEMLGRVSFASSYELTHVAHNGFVRRAVKPAGTNQWIVDNGKDFDYGNF